MGWGSQFSNAYAAISKPEVRPLVAMSKVDLTKVVALDFETFYDADYTLRKLSTSEYIRDPRFHAQMMALKIGRRKTRVIPPKGIKAALAAIDWKTHGLLAHNTAFDGFILSHHFKVKPAFYYDTLSMARGLHSNDIGAGLDEVARYYGVGSKLEGILVQAKGIRELPAALYKQMAEYCGVDAELTFEIFQKMLASFPADELQLVDRIIRMFCDPVLSVDREAVQTEHTKEVEHKKQLMLSVLTTADRNTGTIEDQIAKARKIVGSRDGYVALLEAEGITPPTKLNAKGETAYAFAKTDVEFVALTEHPKQRVRDLVEARLGVKSSLNETRALRFLEASKNGWKLPVGYGYYRASTGRLGGSNKMNMQSLPRGGALRRSILAAPGHVLPVCDSGQIEARVNAWLWGQDDLLEDFRQYDRGLDRDPYCKFGDDIYGREITKKDTLERFVGKVGILGLGYQMGAPKLQGTLATGAMGPAVFLDLSECKAIVNTYRRKNHRIVWGWSFCAKTIIPDMYAGRAGSYKCLHWEKGRIWLPNGMCLKYPGLRLHNDPDSTWEEWTYESKGVTKKIYGGLLCLGGETEVLTDAGWKRLVDVRSFDHLWDGNEWVSHDGLVLQGFKQTINFGGVAMTPDHQVLVDDQWIEAQHTTYAEATSSSARHHWAPARDVASQTALWKRWATNAVDLAVRLWKAALAFSYRIHQRAIQVMRLFNESDALSRSRDARYVAAPGFRSMALDARSMPVADSSGVEELRWARDHSLRRVDHVRSVLAGHGGDLQSGPYSRAARQRTGLLRDQLPLGDLRGPSQQPSRQPTSSDALWTNEGVGSGVEKRDQPNDSLLPTRPWLASVTNVRRRVVYESDLQPVYDILNAGPRRRFMIRGRDRKDFIVHNCENVTQALARIIVTTQLLEISRTRRVVMMTHDEVVAMVRAAQGQKALAGMIKIMSTAPAWCPDIPLTAEGSVDVFYSK